MASQKVISEADLNTCLESLEGAGKGAADGDRAEEGRMLDVLKQLRKANVTADLLKRTSAGKRLNKFCKHSSEAVSQAAKAAVEAWKQCVKQQQSQQADADADDNEASQGSRRAEPASTSGAAQQAPLLGRAASGPTPKPSAPLARTPSTSYKAPPRCGNDTRDKVRVMLAESLSISHNAAESDAEQQLSSLNLLAAGVEDALHELFSGVTNEYKAKARSLTFNLKDAKNPDLRERVLSGIISPSQLVRMSAEDMASDELKKKNQELKEYLAKEATRGTNNTATTDMFQCGRCKQRKTTYYQLQTRSADEPMTTFVTCVNCGQRWKFC